jgi:hypothetical protein
MGLPDVQDQPTCQNNLQDRYRRMVYLFFFFFFFFFFCD